MAKEYEQLVISDDSEMHNRGTEDTKANLPLNDECVKIFFNTKGKTGSS